MIKVLQACIGQYIEGSGAEEILTKNDVFGVNVVKSVLTGKHYKKSLYGLFLLCEAIERLQCEAFLDASNIDRFSGVLTLIKEMKESVIKKEREQSKLKLELFVENAANIHDAFTKFKEDMAEKSETFKFWAQFVSMVGLLKNLVRSVKEGNWLLHLCTIKSILPLFAVFNRTNYLRWCSLYLEDMQNLEKSAPDVYRHFMRGNFAVKRTLGKFKAVPADQCLEQTINRSQKSCGGVIGNTKRKEFVAQWELIYHETLDVVNLHRGICNIVSRYAESGTNHEFDDSHTNQTEQRLTRILST